MYFIYLCIRNECIHGYKTRQNFLLHPPESKSQITSNIIRMTGYKLYNYFIDRVKMNCSYPTYKKNIKIHIIENDVMSIF